MNRSITLLACAAALALAACATTPAPKTISQTAAATPELSTLTRLLKEADLTDTLQGTGPFTVFAPTDAAFKAVPAATMEALAKDKARLKAVLTYHVVPGTLTSAELKNGPLKTVQGKNVALYRSGTFLTVEEALVTTADVRASNGVIQIVDKVLIPPAR
ncbi:MAG: fasciclin domain-containing protein [Burkholderiales bacterium]|nr:fasciclin domain-containing protein [Burkholderiales bacterium]